MADRAADISAKNFALKRKEPYEPWTLPVLPDSNR
jgi:hypothetical protein